MSHQARFEALSLQLPPAPEPIGLYRPIQRVGGQLWTSGHLPISSDKPMVTGRVGDDLSIEQGAEAARLAALAMLATLLGELGTLDKVARLVKTAGFVCCTPEFTDHPKVINGFSQVMADVFGEDCGIAARTALAASSLPAGAAVEIEAVFELA